METLHVDDFVAGHGEDTPEYGDTTYARYMLMYFRLSAVLHMDFARFYEDKQLFCTYEGARYRCTGASRMGDVWLTSDFKQSQGYEKRVDVNKCLNWGGFPEDKIPCVQISFVDEPTKEQLWLITSTAEKLVEWKFLEAIPQVEVKKHGNHWTVYLNTTQKDRLFWLGYFEGKRLGLNVGRREKP